MNRGTDNKAFENTESLDLSLDGKSKARPLFEYFAEGISEFNINRGWVHVLPALLRNSTGAEVVAIAAIAAFCAIAVAFINEGEVVDTYGLIGGITTAAMILVVSLNTTFQEKKRFYAQNWKENRIDKTKPGTQCRDP